MSLTPRNNVRTWQFKSQFAQLPKEVRKLATIAYQQFLTDPTHPSLRLHALHENRRGQQRPGSFSVSITRKYRAIYLENSGTIVWYWIGSHSDYNSFTGVS